MAYKVSYPGSVGVCRAPGGPGGSDCPPPVAQFGPEGAELNHRRGNPSHRDSRQPGRPQETPGSSAHKPLDAHRHQTRRRRLLKPRAAGHRGLCSQQARPLAWQPNPHKDPSGWTHKWPDEWPDEWPDKAGDGNQGGTTNLSVPFSGRGPGN